MVVDLPAAAEPAAPPAAVPPTDEGQQKAPVDSKARQTEGKGEGEEPASPAAAVVPPSSPKRLVPSESMSILPPPPLQADVSCSSDRTTPILPAESPDPITAIMPNSPTAAPAAAAVSSPAHSSDSSSAPSSAASTPAKSAGCAFIDDAAGEGDEEAGEDLSATKTSDDIEMTAEEEAAGLAEIKATFLAKDADTESSPHAQAVLNRQMDDQREDQEMAQLKLKFAVRGQRSLGETLAAQAASKGAHVTSSQPAALVRQESVTVGGKRSLKDSILSSADSHAALAAAKSRELRARLGFGGGADSAEHEEQEEDDETIERRRKERAKILAAKSLGKRHIVPTSTGVAATTLTITRTLTSSAIVRADTAVLASTTTITTTASASLSATLELQSEPTLMLDTPSLSAPLLSRQDSSSTSLSAFPSAFGKSLSHHVGGAAGAPGAQRAQLLAGRVAGRPLTGKPPSAGAGGVGKENAAPSIGMTTTSFAKFNEDLRRQQSVKLIRAGSFLKRTGSVSAHSPSSMLQRSLSTLCQDGATDFSMLLETGAKSTASASTPAAAKSNVASSMGGHVAAKKAAHKGAKAFVFRAAGAGDASRDGFEHERSMTSASASATPTTNATATAAAAPTGPVSFTSFLTNAKKSFSTAGPSSSSSSSSAGLKRSNASAFFQGHAGENSTGGSSLLNKLAKKAKKS